MGINMHIGEAKIRVDGAPDDEADSARVDIVAEVGHYLESPTWPGEGGPLANWSSTYGFLADWSRSVGLYEFFHGDEEDEDCAPGIVAEHPGAHPIFPRHLATIRKAIARWVKRHPGTTPGICHCAECVPHTNGAWPEHRDLDFTLVKLLWFEWWFDWALKNCKVPVISNS